MAATVIDSLVVTLGIDPKNFSKGQQQAIEQLRKFQADAVKGGKELEGQQKKMAESLSSLKREAIGFLGLSFGGAAARAFLDYVTNLDAAIGRTAKTLHESTEDLSAWQGAVEQSGGQAASITGTMQGLTGAMQQLVLTGNASFVPLFNQLGVSLYRANGQLKNSSELLLDLARATEGMDPRRAHALLSMVPGMNEDSINLLIRGRAAVEAYLEAARRAGVTSRADAEAAQAFNAQLVLLERTATSTGRSLVERLLPGMTKFLEVYGRLIQAWNSAPDWVRRVTAPFNPVGAAVDAVGGLSKLAGGGASPAAAGGRATFAERFSGAGGGSAADQEAYIRQAAAARGIDPATAVAVARSEGLGGAYAGDRGSSFGPYQLHYGGVAGGGMAVGGLGDEFTRKTGLNARDPATWKAQVDFALDQAKGGGWGPWHGWRGAPYAGIGARGAAAASVTNNSRGGDTTTNSSNIGTIVIHAEGGSSSEIAGGIRGSVAASFNGGLQ